MAQLFRGDFLPVEFPIAEVAALRYEILKHHADTWEVAELLCLFLKGHGYGVTMETTRQVSQRIGINYPVELLKQELENLALQI